MIKLVKNWFTAGDDFILSGCRYVLIILLILLFIYCFLAPYESGNVLFSLFFIFIIQYFSAHKKRPVVKLFILSLAFLITWYLIANNTNVNFNLNTLEHIVNTLNM